MRAMRTRDRDADAREAMETAAKTVSKLAADAEQADLVELLREAPREAYSFQNAGWPSDVVGMKKEELPGVVLERYNTRQSVCFCGVLPEISRAWASVDNALFLWRLDVADDVPVEYSGEEQAIVAVGLVKPKSGVFLEAISYVLVIATTVELVMVGVCLEDDGRELTLHPLQYSCPTDATIMNDITSTPEGRIFLAGADEALYELVYAQSDTWHSKRCKKVRHSQNLSSLLPSVLRLKGSDALKQVVVDAKRGILYTRSEQGVVVVYDVGAAAFSPNGYWVASGDAGGFLRVWSWDNPEHVLKVEVQVFAGAIKDLQWDGESKKIVVVGDGKGVVAKCVMWDTGNAAGEMVGHSKKAITCAYRQARPFRIMTGSEDFKCAFYKGPPFKLDHTCAEHKNYVNKVAYAPSGDLIASVGSDKKIVLYDGKEGTVAGELKGDGKAHPQGSVYSCAWAPDSSKLLTASADKALHLWDVGAKSLVATKAMGTDVADMQMAAVWVHGQAMSVSLSGDFNYLDEALNVTKVVQAPQAPVSAMAVVGSTIVAGCNDGTVFKSTDAKSWTKLKGAVPRSHVRAAHGGKVTAVAAFGGGFATAGFDDTVRFCDGAAYDAEVKVDGQPKGLAALGGDNVAVATTKGLAIVSKGATFAGVVKFEAVAWDATALAAAPDGSKFAVGAKDGAIRVFDASLAEVAALPPQRGEITALAWSPDRAAWSIYRRQRLRRVIRRQHRVFRLSLHFSRWART